METYLIAAPGTTEILNIVIELRNIDVILKSSSVDSKLLFHPFIIKVCKGYYESK